MPTSHSSRTASDTPAQEPTSEETINVPASTLEALQQQIKDMQDRLAKSETDKEAAVKAATPVSNVEDITPEKDPVVEDTFIVYRHNYTEDGVQKSKDYRMKSEDFAQICAERGW